MNRASRTAALALALALVTVGRPCRGEVCGDLDAMPEDAQTAAAILADLANDKCLGGRDKPCLRAIDDLCRDVDAFEALTVDPDDPASERALSEAFERLPDQLIGALPPVGREEVALREEMRSQFSGYLQRGDAAIARARFQPIGLVFFANDTVEVDLEELLAASCPASCAVGFRRAARFYTVASLYRRSLGKLLESERRATLAYLDGLEKRWQAYFRDAYSQFPWELAVNSGRYRRSATLAEPPTRQIILAHPGIAYEVIDGPDGETLEEALTLEAVGLYRWSFEENKIRRPFGASLVVSWHGSSSDEIGYGVLVHLPRSWSLGVTYRDDSDLSALFSADVGKLLTNGRGVYERIFD